MLGNRQRGIINQKMIADGIEAIRIAKFYFFDGFLACAHFFKEDAEPQFLRGVNRIARICKSYFQ
ncbi:hypothetical protein D9M69_695970 [compost metagenome]